MVFDGVERGGVTLMIHPADDSTREATQFIADENVSLGG